MSKVSWFEVFLNFSFLRSRSGKTAVGVVRFAGGGGRRIYSAQLTGKYDRTVLGSRRFVGGGE